MSGKKKVISRQNLPEKPPIAVSILTLIALDHWNADGVLRGILYTVLGLYWVVFFYALSYEKPVDIFEDKE
jgi:hypothetical protein